MAGRLPVNNQIAYNLQDIFNLLPNLNVESLVRSLQVKANDMHLVLYLSALIRSVLALHGLLANKIKYRDMDDVLDRDAGIEGVAAATAPSDEEKDSSSSSPGKDKDGSPTGKDKET